MKIVIYLGLVCVIFAMISLLIVGFSAIDAWLATLGATTGETAIIAALVLALSCVVAYGMMKMDW